MAVKLKLKRVYEAPGKGDGFRVLVDRLWPRGVSKDQARVGLWLKEIAPSDALRKWFGHEPAKWDEFKRRYFKELDGEAELVQTLRGQAAKGAVTLLYGAKEERFNNAVALKEYLDRH
ncbi:MAG: DUF488 domain-containing protein [Gammaproteobacteria bacterium]|nr:DUF488 domain-containing protein [Gammaproteobacteria bacterium]